MCSKSARHSQSERRLPILSILEIHGFDPPIGKTITQWVETFERQLPCQTRPDYYLLLFPGLFRRYPKLVSWRCSEAFAYFSRNPFLMPSLAKVTSSTTAAGAPGTRLSLFPLFSRDMRNANFGPYLRRENAGAHLRPYPQLSSPHRVSPSANPTKQSTSIGAARWIASLLR